MPKQRESTAKVSKSNSTGSAKSNGLPTKGGRSYENLRSTIEQQLSKSEKPGKKPKRTKHVKKPSGPIATDSNATAIGERGKKRDSNGNIKQDAPAARESDRVDTSSDEDAFETEVRALGGTNEDIELLADALSDSELEGAEPTQANAVGGRVKGTIESGMSNIMKEISLAQGTAKDGVDDSDEPVDVSDTESPPEPPSVTSRKNKTGLRCEVRPDWFAPIESLRSAETVSKSSIPNHIVKALQEFAEELLEEENGTYKQKHSSGSSQSFYNTVIASGTLSDKISALTLAVQDSPIHNKKALENLLSLSKKRGRSQAVDVLRALKDLLAQGALLPSSRRLYSFATQPRLVHALRHSMKWGKGDQLPKGITEEYLILWAFESWLKEQYFEILQTLEVWCNDELEFAKSRAMSYVYELLKEKPEQESNLLRLLINKLGDPVKKIASQASYLLMQLLTVHPAMKRIVVTAIETDFIFRPGQSLHSKYYATVTLNQTALSANEEDIAQKLLETYFALFSTLLKTGQNAPPEPSAEPESKTRAERQRRKKPVESGQAQTDELSEKLTSALLTGVNRAYPYADAAHKSFEKQLDTLFKIAHSANFNTSLQAMLLIQQLSVSHQPSNDRFYRVLYESLLDPRLITASKQQLYLNLLHRALKADLSARRIKAFVKRILQILSLHDASFVCGAFFLLKDLESSFPGLTSLTDQAEEADDEEEDFRDVDDSQDDSHQVNTGSETVVKTSGKYDGHKRAPEHANADNSCAWEVLPFLAHFHPSVTVSTDNYLRHAPLPGKPDLSLHTLIHFLDRFVYRNAKLSDSKMRGSSIMQPMASDNTRAMLFNSSSGGSSKLSVNSDAFKAKKDENVAAEDIFFHKYFSALGKESRAGKTPKSAKTEDDGESDDEDAVWKAMLDTAPELEGAEDEDDDVDMSDLEAAMGDKFSADESDDASAEGGVDVEAGLFDDSDEDMVDSDDQDDMGAFAELDSDVGDLAEESSHQEETKEIPAGASKRNEATKAQRKKLRGLPVFASADDYAKMLDDDEDEDFGQ